jgi:hypothetical protein
MVLLISVIFGEITSLFCYSSDGLKNICYDYDRIWYFRDSLTLKVLKPGFEIKSEHCISQNGLRVNLPHSLYFGLWHQTGIRLTAD